MSGIKTPEKRISCFLKNSQIQDSSKTEDKGGRCRARTGGQDATALPDKAKTAKCAC
jgi:hypothetical protein